MHSPGDSSNEAGACCSGSRSAVSQGFSVDPDAVSEAAVPGESGKHVGPVDPVNPSPVLSAAATPSLGAHTITQAKIPAHTFAMGDHHGDGLPVDGETPVHDVHVDSFSIDITPVTNADFAKFVEETGFETESERFGFSAVFHLALAAPEEDILGSAPGTPWWLAVRGATWKNPGGTNSNIAGLANHPVVHVSWNDAIAYCQWARRALPTEAQWEAAARGGLEAKRYPWGDDRRGDDRAEWNCNIWQGDFPTANTQEDGFLTTAPVKTFTPNAFGLWQTVGNVWEWCSDWFDPRYYKNSPRTNPTGPSIGLNRVMRGGSFLCHDSYCNRYRNAARTSNAPDSASSNQGFRTVSI